MSITRIIAEIHGLRQLPRAAYGILAGTYCLTFFRDGFDVVSVCAALSYAALTIFAHVQPTSGSSLAHQKDEQPEIGA